MIDTANNTVIATIPVGDGPEGLAVNPAGTRVYVSHVGLDTVRVIDTGSNSVVGVMPAGDFSANLAVSPDGARIYVTTANNNVVVLNATNDTLVTTIPVGQSPTGLVVNPAGTCLYVANINSDDVSVIDTASNTVIATVPLDASQIQRTYPYGVAINPAGSRVYVANAGSVSVIDTASNTVITTLPGGNSRGIDATPDGARLYVGVGGNQVRAFDLTTNTAIATIPVGSAPVAVGDFIGPSTILTSTTTSSTTSTSTTAPTSATSTTTSVSLATSTTSTSVSTTTSPPPTTAITTTTTTTNPTSQPCPPCDDGDPCTSDLCSTGQCVHQGVTGRHAATCAFERAVACGGTPVPASITRAWSRARDLTTAAMGSSSPRASQLLRRSASLLAKATRRLGKLAQRRTDLMPSDCAGALEVVLADASGRVATCLARRCFAPTTTTTTTIPSATTTTVATSTTTTTLAVACSTPFAGQWLIGNCSSSGILTSDSCGMHDGRQRSPVIVGGCSAGQLYGQINTPLGWVNANYGTQSSNGFTLDTGPFDGGDGCVYQVTVNVGNLTLRTLSAYQGGVGLMIQAQCSGFSCSTTYEGCSFQQ